MQKKLSNTWLWILLIILVIFAFKTFTLQPCSGSPLTDGFVDQTTDTNITDCDLLTKTSIDSFKLAKTFKFGILLVLSAFLLIKIFHRRKLNLFIKENSSSQNIENKRNLFTTFKYWLKPIFIGILVIGIMMSVIYYLINIGLLK